jgi:excinuclease ABC subunit C
MREVVTRRYLRLKEERPRCPGGCRSMAAWGSASLSAEALRAIGILDPPLASIAKREEIIYVYGQEDEPYALDRFSPILHLWCNRSAMRRTASRSRSTARGATPATHVGRLASLVRVPIARYPRAGHGNSELSSGLMVGHFRKLSTRTKVA